MASVFLSYDRDDAERARPLAQALEKAGHSVWWDLHVRGGAQFSKVIEEALKASDAVVVLWSRNSIESAWVRDEAAAGRDAGKLVPVTVDGTESPLGFRQYQSINFARWKGRARAAEFKLLLQSISGLGGTSTEVAPSATPSTAWPKVAHALIVVFIGIVILGGVFAGSRLLKRPSIPIVAVVAPQPTPENQTLARDLFAKLGRLQAVHPEALQIVDAAAGKKADFTFQVSASAAAATTTVNVTLIGHNRALLWAEDFERPSDEYSDLKQQLSLTAARVLDCATQAVTDRVSKLDQLTLKLYLKGCARLSELAWTDYRDLVPVFREVTRRAPRFEGGWAKLVETEAYVLGWETLPSTSSEGQKLTADVATARNINPRMAEAYWAEWVLLGEPEVGRSAELVDRATRDNPDAPLILGIRATFLSRIGRMNEALEVSKRAAELSPLSGDATAGYIVALTYAGHLEAAAQELAKAERVWPGTRTLIDARFRFHARYGDPKEALRIVRSGVHPDFVRFESFLLARIDPTKENVDRAIADAQAQVGQSPRGSGWLIQALAEFRRENEIYAILEELPKTSPVYAAELFFRPNFHRFRQDVRFLKLAKNLGLVDYWRSTGKWPDFCSEPDLPYDCRAEAAKVSA